MQVFAMPEQVRGLIFDIDLTLYDNRDYYNSLEQLLVQRLSQHRGEDVAETKAVVNEIRETFARNNNGRKLSLGNAFLQLGVDIPTNAAWRDAMFQPEHYLTTDHKLIHCLTRLAQCFKLAAVTNNAHGIAVRTLAALGVGDFFEPVIGLDQSGVSKPTMVPFQMVVDHWKIPVTEWISIGDRVAVDLERPIAAGMGGILVTSLADVYELPTLLNCN